MCGDYFELHIRVSPLEPGREILNAHLSQLPFESVMETEDGLKAYMPEQDWKEKYRTALEEVIIPETRLSYSYTTIKAQNWNATWEAGFAPIRVDDQCHIRAPFHPKSEARFDIEIMPKMSFGTGHHETTHLMLQMLLDEKIPGKKVLDMGCGTGILAILACKMGAAEVYAIDIDSWSYENTLENTKRNSCHSIVVVQADASVLAAQSQFDLILANINKNVLLEDIPIYSEQLASGGVLILSGFYKDDLEDIDYACRQTSLMREKFQKKNNWVAAKYVF